MKTAGKKNDKSNRIEYLKIGGIQTYNATKIINSFAKYFSEVGKKFTDKIPTSSKSITDYLRMMRNHTKSIFLLPTEENEIRKIAFELPTKSSSGYDNVSNVLLKENNRRHCRAPKFHFQSVHAMWQIPR